MPMVLLLPIRKRAFNVASGNRKLSSICWAFSSIFMARGNKLWPLSLSTRRLPTRSNRRVPSALSSSLSAALVADWDNASALPALVVLPKRVIAQKICS
ncbi:hypothetical protein A584_07590 [Pseudomonas syringae pv. theae ICMP 3923]|nr:hypothetical protein A262_07250 [Pseudomonas syringae pv. actinidiae ICMP 19073]EPM71880.1 hypothetical protein A584_07590 [Pseudomonas syringae pv. theae ICMP 3923]